MTEDEFELEIDWIPEDTGAPYEAEDVFVDVPAHEIDKICKKSMVTKISQNGRDDAYRSSWQPV